MKKLLISLLLFSTSVWAWQPTKPINVNIGYGAGSNNEVVFRKVSEMVTRNNPGVVFVIRAQAGADGAIIMNSFFKADADGYNVAVPSVFNLFVGNEVFQSDIKQYNWDSFSPVAVLGESPYSLVAAADSPVNTPADFLQLLKNPTRFINVNTSSSATSFIFEHFMNQNGSRNMIENIPYKSVPEQLTAILSGQTEFGVMSVAGAIKLAEAGKIKIIGITGDQALPNLPSVPVMKSIKLQSGWFVTLPPNAPQDIVDWYQQEFGRVVRSEEYQHWARSQLITVDPAKLDPSGVKKYAEFLRRTFLPMAAQLNKNK